VNPRSVALVGCGDIAYGYAIKLKHEGIHTHCDSLSLSSKFRLMAACDSDEKKAFECSASYDFPNVYHSFEDLIRREKVEVVVICTPDDTHANLAKLALSIPTLRAIVMEKPIALSSADAEQLILEAGSKNVILAVNYSRRYSPVIQALHEKLSSESIRSLCGYYSKGVFHNGTHWFDLADFLGGKVVTTKAKNSMRKRSPDPTLDVYMEFSNGATGFLAGCDEQEYTLFEMDILTDKGRYRLTDSGRTLQTWISGDSLSRSGFRALFPDKTAPTSLGESLPSLWEDLAKCLDTGAVPISNSQNAIQALKVAETALRSSESGNMEAVR